MTKRAKWSLLLVGGIVLFFLFMPNFSKEESPKQQPKKEKVEVVQETNEDSKKEIDYVSDEELENTTVQNFITELIGSDYTMLPVLFNPNCFPKDISNMTEEELYPYLDEIGAALKDNKKVVSGSIVSYKSKGLEGDQYKIVLNLNDGTTKEMKITVNKNEIVTPIEDLY